MQIKKGYQPVAHLRVYVLLDVSEAAAVCRKRQVPDAIAARLSRGRPLYRSHWNVRRHCTETYTRCWGMFRASADCQMQGQVSN